MIDSYLAIIGVCVLVLFIIIWLMVIPFVIMSICDHVKRFANASENILRKLNDLEKQLSESDKK